MSCLIEGCPWSNSKSQLIKHVIRSHPDIVMTDFKDFPLDLTQDQKFSFVFKSLNRKYFFVKVRNDGGIIRCSVMCVENVANCNEYVFDVTFYTDDYSVRYEDKKVELYRETDVNDDGTFKVPISDLNFHGEVFNVRFVVKRSSENVDLKKA